MCLHPIVLLIALIKFSCASIEESKFLKIVSYKNPPIQEDKWFSFTCVGKCGRSLQCSAVNVKFTSRQCIFLTQSGLSGMKHFEDLLFRKIYPPASTFPPASTYPPTSINPPTPTNPPTSTYPPTSTNPLTSPPTCRNGGSWADAEKTHCNCVASYAGTYCERYWEDCSEGYDLEFRDHNRVYTIQPRSSPDAFQVRCDLRWGRTFIQSQRNGDDFDRDWQSYKDGFGDVDGDHWLGLEKIRMLCKDVYCRLLVNMRFRSEPRFKHCFYYGFSLNDESDDYRISYSYYQDNNLTDGQYYTLQYSLEDGLVNGTRFSTKDRDNDNKTTESCAQTHQAGWWFTDCGTANPNGQLHREPPNGVFWQGEPREVDRLFLAITSFR